MSPRTFTAFATWLFLLTACSDESNNECPGGATATCGSGGSGTNIGKGGAGGFATAAGGTGTASSTGGTGTGSSTGGTGSAAGGAGGNSSPGFACQYPGDIGIDGHGAVVWTENFEQGSLAGVLARYDDYKNQAGMLLDSDIPSVSSGAASMRLTAGGGTDATDFFKNFGTGWDELYVRYYVKYQDNVNWHHTGLWISGYTPATTWANPQAGTKPNGNDRFSVSLEPLGNGTNPRLDFYNYWMGMRTNPGGGFWGNTLVHDTSLIATHDWQCVEIHIRLNPDPNSAAGAELGVWRDDESIVQYDDQGPMGRWLHDKFCRPSADSPDCTNFTLPPPDVVLDLQWRTTTDLKINNFWVLNYITSGPAGNVWYDDVVIATERIGCICPN